MATEENPEHPSGTVRELREYARGTLDTDHHDVHPIAGLIEDDDVREVLGFMAEVWNPSPEDLEAGAPRDFWETELAQRAIRQHATDVADAAIRDGNVTQAAYLTGRPSYKSDVSGLHAINQLADWLVHSEQCKLVYLAALMGRGKTDLSVTLLEVIHDHFRRVHRALSQQGRDDIADDVPTPEFAANFHVSTPTELDVEVREIRTERRLLEWADGGSSDDERWFIFDEASTELTAQSGANAQKVAETMAPFVKKMRKKGINMIVIGHDKGDVHVAIRSLADFVDKQGLKTASFYAGIESREPVGHLFDLDGIPPTSWEFDTDDTAEWTWLAEEEAEDAEDQGMTDQEFKDEIAKRGARIWLTTGGKQGPLTQADVADAISTEEVSVSATTISRRASELQPIESGTSAAVAD